MSKPSFLCRLAVPLLVTTTVLAGCGGSGSGGGPTAPVALKVPIAWPTRSREFQAPLTAQSASITLVGGGTDGKDYAFTVDRPAGAAGATVTALGPVGARPGSYTLRLAFFDAAGATGGITGTAYASTQVAGDGTIKRPDGNAIPKIGFSTNIAGILGLPVSVGLGQSAAVNVEGWDFENNPIAIAAGTAHVEAVTGTEAFAVNADGTVEGLKTGTGTIQVTVDHVTSRPSPVTVTQAVLFGLRRIALNTSSVVYEPVHGALWATVPSTGVPANSLVKVDPNSGTVSPPIPVGEEPGLAAVSSDGSQVYVGLLDSGGVRSVNTTTLALGQEFYLPPDTSGVVPTVTQVAVQPGSPQTVAIAERVTDGEILSIFDAGVERVKALNTVDGLDIAWASTTRIINSPSHVGPLIDCMIDSSGVVSTKDSYSYSQAVGHIEVSGNRIYTADGSVTDLATLSYLGEFGRNTTHAYKYVAIDDANRTGFVISEVSSPPSWNLSTYNLDTFQLTGTWLLNVDGAILPGFYRWGAKGLVFRTATSIYFADNAPGL